MHELSVMNEILKTILDHARNHGAQRIVAVNLRVGELTDLLDEWMQKYFDHLSKGTLAEKAILRIERSRILLTCNDCGHATEVAKGRWDRITCHRCGGNDLVMTAGREFYIKNIEVA